MEFLRGKLLIVMACDPQMPADELFATSGIASELRVSIAKP